MSADNGIYILETPNRRTGFTEYRVAHCQAIENIHCPEDTETEDSYLRMLFGKCNVLNDRLAALRLAQEIYDEIMNSDFAIIEYGIQTIRFPREFPVG